MTFTNASVGAMHARLRAITALHRQILQTRRYLAVPAVSECGKAEYGARYAEVVDPLAPEFQITPVASKF